MKTFKLIVTVNDNCIAVLKYIAKCITMINNMGVRVQVEKIANEDFDAEMVAIMRKKGILRLPALIAPDGAKFIGVNDITGLFEKNLKSARTVEKVEPIDTSNVHDFMLRSIQKIDPKENDDIDDRVDFDARMRDYQTRVPSHRGGGAQRERNVNDAQPQQAPAARRQPPRVTQDRGRDTNQDNVDGGEYPEYQPQMPTPNTDNAPDMGDAANDEMYRKMVEALMDKTD